jgi:hypothetical protein
LRQALPANTEARHVHHDEHGLQALHFLADEIAGGTVIVHHAGRVRVDAHLVFDGSARQAVAGTKAAVFVQQKLRHDEEADAFDGVGRTRGFCENQVDDVVGKVMLAR